MVVLFVCFFTTPFSVSEDLDWRVVWLGESTAWWTLAKNVWPVPSVSDLGRQTT